MSELDRHRRLEVLFDKHAAAVRAYALRRIDPGNADDIVSEVFVVAWRRIDEIPPDALPWLLACARRTLANQYRGDRRRGALLERLSSVEHSALVPPVTEDGPPLLLALTTLSDGDRELLMMIAWEGLDPARAAAALQCSRATLAVRLHRARRRLSAALETVGQGASLTSHQMEAVE